MDSTNEYSAISGEKEIVKKSYENDQDEPLLVVGGEKSYRVTSMRWVALVFACFLMIGNYMSYDFPAYMQDSLAQVIFNCPNVSDTEDNPNCKSFNKYYPWLYSIYSFPNCLLPLFGGFFIDKIGVRVGLILFSTLVTLGQFVCAMAGTFAGGWGYSHHVSVFVWFYIGRFIFSLGGENITVTQSTIISKWFVGKELAFAMGTNLSCARLGSVVGGFAYPALNNSNTSLTWPLMFADIICVVSFLFMMGLVIMDKKADQQEGKNANTLDPSEQVKLSDIKDFSLLYWILTISCLLNYIGMFVFLQNANGYLKYNYQDGETEASQYMTIPYLISACLSPFIGILVDKIGQRQWLLLFSSCIMLLSHVMWLTFPTCPAPEPVCSKAWQIIPLVTMGIFYSFYAAILWPCIPLVLDPKVVGTGFGVTTAVQNLGLALGPLIVSAIINNTHKRNGYFYSQLFFVVLGGICVCVAVWLIIQNARRGNPIGLKSGGTAESIAKQSKASFRR